MLVAMDALLLQWFLLWALAVAIDALLLPWWMLWTPSVAVVVAMDTLSAGVSPYVFLDIANLVAMVVGYGYLLLLRITIVAMVVAMDTLPSSQIVQVKGFCPVCVLICSWTLPIWLPWWLLWIPAVAIDKYCCYGGCYGYLTFITDSAIERFLSSVCSNVFLDIANLVEISVTLKTSVDSLA